MGVNGYNGGVPYRGNIRLNTGVKAQDYGQTGGVPGLAGPPPGYMSDFMNNLNGTLSSVSGTEQWAQGLVQQQQQRKLLVSSLTGGMPPTGQTGLPGATAQTGLPTTTGQAPSILPTGTTAAAPGAAPMDASGATAAPTTGAVAPGTMDPKVLDAWIYQLQSTGQLNNPAALQQLLTAGAQPAQAGAAPQTAANGAPPAVTSTNAPAAAPAQAPAPAPADSGAADLLSKPGPIKLTSADIDKIDLKKVMGMGKDKAKDILGRLDTSGLNQSDKDRLAVKFILSANNKFADDMGVGHDNLEDRDFSAHDLHVIRDLAKNCGQKDIADSIDKIAEHRDETAKAAGGSTSGSWGQSYLHREDLEALVSPLKGQPQDLDKLIKDND